MTGRRRCACWPAPRRWQRPCWAWSRSPAALGVSWLSASLFSTPAKVRLAITPGTGVGYTLAALLHDARHLGLLARHGVGARRRRLRDRGVRRARCCCGACASTGWSRCSGLTLLVAAAGGPAAWPWYFIWGLVLVAALPRPAALPGARGRRSRSRRFWSSPTGCWRSRSGPPPVVLVVYLVIAGVAWNRRRRAAPRGAGCRLGPEPALRGQRHPVGAGQDLTRPCTACPSTRGRATAPRCAAPGTAGGGARLIAITTRSLGFDEGATVAIVSQHGSALGSAIARDGGNMSGYYLLMHVLVGWFGTGLSCCGCRRRWRRWRRWRSSGCSGCGCSIGAWPCRRGCWPRSACRSSTGRRPPAATRRWWRSCAPDSSPSWSLAERDRRPSRAGRWAVVGYVVAMVLASYCELRGRARRPRAAAGAGPAAGGAAPVRWALVALAVCCIPLVVLAVRRGSGQLFWVPRPIAQGRDAGAAVADLRGLQPSFHPPVHDHHRSGADGPGAARTRRGGAARATASAGERSG